MRAHQIAESLIEDAFEDATKLKTEIITVEIARQLSASICGIDANIAKRIREALPGSAIARKTRRSN